MFLILPPSNTINKNSENQFFQHLNLYDIHEQHSSKYAFDERSEIILFNTNCEILSIQWTCHF
ncbi:hypothetical protein LMED105_09870 [Limnobacter sp. MED105]|nr:hypothetical protein LMED105_09870 [Limnobacter sp. MED105]